MTLCGCLVSDPKEYRSPERTPPLLLLTKAEPSVFKLRRVSYGSQVDFNVPFRSEDAGEKLLARLRVNYTLPNEEGAGERPLNASTFDDESRAATLSWVPSKREVDPGCQQLSLLVAHDSSITTFDKGLLILDPKDVAVAVWTLWVDDPADSEAIPGLDGCPVQETQ